MNLPERKSDRGGGRKGGRERDRERERDGGSMSLTGETVV